MRKMLCLVVFLSVFLVTPVFAHPGRTDAYGCHTCRTNCSKWGLSSGEYHCHRAKELPQPIEPIKSTFSETGGTTRPAPEYKKPAPAAKPIVVPVKKPLEKKIVEPQVSSTEKQLAPVYRSSVKEKRSFFQNFFELFSR